MLFKRLLFFITVATTTSIASHAQENVVLTSSHPLALDQAYRRNDVIHTAWKPLLFTDSVTPSSQNKWIKRKFLEEHLLNVQEPGFNIYGDIIVDEYIGYDKRGTIPKKNIPNDTYKVPMMNTRGYEVTGNIGSKFYFETNFYENQGRFAAYIDSIVRPINIEDGVHALRMIPRQARYKPERRGDGPGFDWSYSNARLVYIPTKHTLFELGYGRNFIGDGYRSMLMSDYATDNPYFKTTLTFGKFQYSAMWSQYFVNIDQPHNLYAYGYERKWGNTYLIDYQVTKNFTASLFQSIMQAGVETRPNENGTLVERSDLTASFASPLIFAHGGKSKSGVKNNQLVGLNLKYKVANKTFAYGQFAADEFGKDTKNRYAAQIGIRSADLGGVDNLNALVEFNTARPYTYSSSNTQTTYSHSLVPLAHPLGANFKEFLGTVDYTYKRWWIRFEAFAAQSGNDSTGISDTNFGRSVINISGNYPTGTISTGQGVKTNIYFGDLKLAFVLNKKTNLRIEGGLTYRSEKNYQKKYEDIVATIGVRMSFRNLVYDF